MQETQQDFIANRASITFVHGKHIIIKVAESSSWNLLSDKDYLDRRFGGLPVAVRKLLGGVRRSAASCCSAMRLSHSYNDRLKGQSRGLGERCVLRGFFDCDFRRITVTMHRLTAVCLWCLKSDWLAAYSAIEFRLR